MKKQAQRSSHYRVSYQLIDTSENKFATGHCLGVNDLISSENLLLTGGRDAFIHAWDIKQPSTPLIHTYSHHSHWINQLELCSPSIG